MLPHYSISPALHCCNTPAWRNWQTRWTQNPVIARSCGFEPLRRHCDAVAAVRCRTSIFVIPTEVEESLTIVLFSFLASLANNKRCLDSARNDNSFEPSAATTMPQ